MKASETSQDLVGRAQPTENPRCVQHTHGSTECLRPYGLAEKGGEGRAERLRRPAGHLGRSRRTVDRCLADLARPPLPTKDHPPGRSRCAGQRAETRRTPGTAEVPVDASALLDLLFGGPLRDAVATRLAGHGIHGPAHLDAERLLALGRLNRAGDLVVATVEQLLTRLADAPITRHPVNELITARGRGATTRDSWTPSTSNWLTNSVFPR